MLPQHLAAAPTTDDPQTPGLRPRGLPGTVEPAVQARMQSHKRPLMCSTAPTATVLRCVSLAVEIPRRRGSGAVAAAAPAGAGVHILHQRTSQIGREHV